MLSPIAIYLVTTLLRVDRQGHIRFCALILDFDEK